MNPEHSHTAISTAKSKFPFARWIYRCALALLFTVVLAASALYSTGGQRWLIGQIVERAAGRLDQDGRKFNVEIDHVDIGVFPPALVLENVALVAEEEVRGDVLCLEIEQLSVLPEDLSGTRWQSIDLRGIHLSAEGWRWLSTIPLGDNGGSEASVFIERLQVEEVVLDLPDSSIVPELNWIAIDQFSLEKGSWMDGTPDWNALNGALRMGTRNPRVARIDTSALAFSGSPDTLHFALDSDPAYWMTWTEESAIPIDLIPKQWEATAIPGDSIFHFNGHSPRAMIDGTMGLDALGMRLDQIHVRLPRGVPEVNEWLESPMEMSVEGPVHYRNNDETWNGPWTERMTGTATVACRGSYRDVSADFDARWNLQTGALHTTLDLLATSSAPLAPSSAALDLSGTLFPLSQLEMWPMVTPVSLLGEWAIDVPGEQVGSGQSHGQLSLVGSEGEPGSPFSRIEIAGDAFTRPLLLSESLELYGGWTFQGECALDGEYALSDWWAHVDLKDGRFIPLSGFSGKPQRGAPMAFKRMGLQSRGNAEHFNLQLASDYAQLEATGPFSTEAWTAPVKEILRSSGLLVDDISSGAVSLHPHHSSTEEWSIDLKVWNDDILDRYSDDAWSIGAGSSLSARYGGGEVNLKAVLKSAHVGAWRMNGVTAEAKGGRSPLAAQFRADQFRHPSMGHLEKMDISGEVDLNGVSHVRSHWDGPVSGDFSLDHALEGKSRHVVTPTSMSLDFQDMIWLLTPGKDSWLSWEGDDWAGLQANDIVLSGSEGIIGLHRPDSSVLENVGLELRMARFPAGPWMGLASRMGNVDLPEAEGFLHGWIGLDLEHLQALGEIQWEDAQLDGLSLGDLCLEGTWTDDWSGRLQQFLSEEEVLTAQFNGLKQAEVSLTQWPMHSLNPALASFGLSVTGHLDGACEIHLSEEEGPVEILGAISLQARALAIEATGMTYAVEGQVDFTPSHIGMDQGQVTDPSGNTAMVNASVQHEGFEDWNWDFGLDLAQPIQVMDLDADPGRLYHGEVFATGEANVSGSSRKIEIEGIASTAAGTRFTMPLDALEGPGLPPGIQFTGVAGDSGNKRSGPEAAPLDFSLSLEIDVTRDAALSMVLDQRAGERVDGQAEGKLAFSRSSSSALNMQGGLAIIAGAYRFSLRDLYSRTISVAEGSRIDWDGDPYDAQLAINAVDRMRANPTPLIPQMFDRGKTDVEVVVGINGALRSPQLGFSVEFPLYERNDPAMLSKVQTVLSTPEETQRQAFALLAMGQFIQPEQEGAQTLGRVVTAQASELISTGVSDLISSLSKDLDIGVRYVPSNTGATDADPNGDGSLQAFRSEDALEMDLGISLLDNRLNISGTVGATGVDGSSEETDFRGGIDIRYQLTSDGRWELVGYSKPESELDEESRYGIGARYQVRFNRLSDLFRRNAP